MTDGGQQRAHAAPTPEITKTRKNIDVVYSGGSTVDNTGTAFILG